MSNEVVNHDAKISRDGQICPNLTVTNFFRFYFGSLEVDGNKVLLQTRDYGKPVLGVSINYRLAAFGFLDSKEVRVS
ncbi:Alpha/Beta hydrolase protein [Penicillium odoratum]|uniref:Alpha/Beta hydrolase protein n=1 Tax=Penicillium odoratum TaxID=1167516 RepID=UPI002547DC1B|nr:Alpha/Beta hydrolase protein [Penicillium odoratum]KAJ5778268.1 Alpha/Beta hydrolase protein [Penicillium odoratum]